MSLMDHLSELRQRLIYSVLALVIGMLVAFFVSIPAIDALKLLAPSGVHFVQLTPGEVLMASFRLSIFLGVVLASPVLLYQLMRFVLPGLNQREKGLVMWVLMGGGALFFGGMAFAYYAVLPPTLEWLLDFGSEVAENQMSIARFIEFCSSLILITGILFELPIVLLLLSFTGVVNSRLLIQRWRMATIAIFLFSAFITPSQDPFSMLLVGVALLALYWISIASIRLCRR